MLNRTAAPDYVQSTAFDLIKPNKKKLSNGIDLFFVQGGAQDVLKIELLFKAGRWFEANAGESYFTSHLLSKGTNTKSSFDIAQLFDRYGAHLEVSAGLDTISIELYSLTKNLTPVIDLLQEILKYPTFPKKELEQSKSIYIQNLKVNLEKTSFLASKHFRKSLFGADHPYGKELEEADIQALQQKNLADYFNSFFKDFSVFVSGKFDATDEAYITDIFSTWHTTAVPEKHRSTPGIASFHQVIEKDESVQSSIRMGGRSMVRTDPDYSKATFVSHILGGYFGSRLMKNIREEKGLTYGIHCSLHPLKHNGYLVIGADVNKENVSLTFEEIRKELRRLRTEEISADELDTARNHFIGSLQSELTTPFAHADKIKNIYQFGLPADFYQQMIATIMNLDQDEILKIGAQHFNEKDFFEIAVG